jgi:hypothetical protein
MSSIPKALTLCFISGVWWNLRTFSFSKWVDGRKSYLSVALDVIFFECLRTDGQISMNGLPVSMKLFIGDMGELAKEKREFDICCI